MTLVNLFNHPVFGCILFFMYFRMNPDGDGAGRSVMEVWTASGNFISPDFCS